MKTRVAMKVLKRHARGHRYRLSTLVAARRQYRYANRIYGISRLALVADNWRAFADAMVQMERAFARFCSRFSLPSHLIRGADVRESRTFIKSTGV